MLPLHTPPETGQRLAETPRWDPLGNSTVSESRDGEAVSAVGTRTGGPQPGSGQGKRIRLSPRFLVLELGRRPARHTPMAPSWGPCPRRGRGEALARPMWMTRDHAQGEAGRQMVSVHCAMFMLIADIFNVLCYSIRLGERSVL